MTLFKTRLRKRKSAKKKSLDLTSSSKDTDVFLCKRSESMFALSMLSQLESLSALLEKLSRLHRPAPNGRQMIGAQLHVSE